MFLYKYFKFLCYLIFGWLIVNVFYFLLLTWFLQILTNIELLLLFCREFILMGFDYIITFSLNYKILLIQKYFISLTVFHENFRFLVYDFKFILLWLEFNFHTGFFPIFNVKLDDDATAEFVIYQIIDFVSYKNGYFKAYWDFLHYFKSVDYLLPTSLQISSLELWLTSQKLDYCDIIGDRLSPIQYVETLIIFFKFSCAANLFMSSLLMFSPLFMYKDTIFINFELFDLEIWLIYLFYILLPIFQYNSLVMVFSTIILFRLLIYIRFLHLYLNSELLGSNIVIFYIARGNIFIFCILGVFFVLNLLNLIYAFALWFLISYLTVMSSLFLGERRFKHFNILHVLLKKFNAYIKSKRGIKKKKKLRKHKRRNNGWFIFFVYKFVYLFKNVFRYYFPFFFFKFFRLKRLIWIHRRKQLFVNFWTVYDNNVLVNPIHLGRVNIPVGLKGSFGGLWLRSTQKNYAMHLMFENKNGLWFFRRLDDHKYLSWEPFFEYGLHIYDQRELILPHSDDFFKFFFGGAFDVYSGHYDKSHIIGSVNHYDRYHKFVFPKDVDTYLSKSRLPHFYKRFQLVLYKIYCYFAPKLTYSFLYIYMLIYNKLYLVSFFLSGIFRTYVEFTLIKIDSRFIPYLRFAEFYKLKSYLPFDYYIGQRFPFFLRDSRRHYNVHFFKELDGWLVRYKRFELTFEAYTISNRGVGAAWLIFVSILALKLSKWTLLFHRVVPFEYLWFSVVSFLSNIWFFGVFFGPLDVYIYKCLNVSVWARRRVFLQTGGVRFRHGGMRSRWFRNRKFLWKLNHGKYLHARENPIIISDLF